MFFTQMSITPAAGLSSKYIQKILYLTGKYCYFRAGRTQRRPREETACVGNYLQKNQRKERVGKGRKLAVQPLLLLMPVRTAVQRAQPAAAFGRIGAVDARKDCRPTGTACGCLRSQEICLLSVGVLAAAQQKTATPAASAD